MPAGIDDAWRKAVTGLESVLAAYDITRSRTALRDLIGEVQVIATPEEIRFETKKGAVEGAFVRAVGGQQMSAVAGARFNLYHAYASH